MIAWQVVVAILGAWCVAAGNAVCERPAARTRGEPRRRFLVTLFTDPLWLAGAALTVLGVALHLLALAHAPVTIVQPLGVSGLLVAVWFAARIRRRRLTVTETGGAAAITVGLAGLIVALPHAAREPVLAPSDLATLCLVAVAAVLVALVVATLRDRRVNAIAAAAAAGVCFGVGSALACVIAHHVRGDLTALVRIETVAALTILAVGGVLLQSAYRNGHFGLSYAVLLIADPVVAAGAGVVFLGEALPADPVGITVVVASAVVVAVGVVALARSADVSRPADETEEASHEASTSRRTDTMKETTHVDFAADPFTH